MDSLDKILESMHHTRNRLLRWGLVLLGCSIGFLATAVLVLSVPLKAAIGVLVFCAFLFIAGIYLLVLASTILHPHKHPVIKHLRHQKYQIVWVYSFISINRPFGVELFKLVTIWLHYRDGSQQHLRIGYAYLDDCMAHLENQLPHATFGYSVEKEQLYRANPALLERE